METRYILSAILYCFRGKAEAASQEWPRESSDKRFQRIHHFLDIVNVLADRISLEEVWVPVKASVQEMG